MALKAGYVGIKNHTIGKLATRSEQAILGAKNLLKPRTGSEIAELSNGITFTYYPDGSVKANGTSTGDAYGSIYQRDSRPLYLPKGNYIFSCPFDNTGAAIEILVVCKRGENNVEYGKCRGNNQVTMNVQEGDAIGIVIHVFTGKTISNMMFYPMIRLASDPIGTYAPYAMTNHELTESLFVKNRVITSADDLNNITESGIYTMTTSPTNAPESVSYVTLLVNTRNENDITQVIITATTLYTRKKSGSPVVWKPWYKFTGTEVQAAKSGDDTTEIEEEPETKTTRSTKKTATIKEGE